MSGCDWLVRPWAWGLPGWRSHLFQSSCPRSHQRPRASCAGRRGAAPPSPSGAGTWGRPGARPPPCPPAWSRYGSSPRPPPHLGKRGGRFQASRGATGGTSFPLIQLVHLIRPPCMQKSPELQTPPSPCTQAQGAGSCRSAPSCPPTDHKLASAFQQEHQQHSQPGLNHTYPSFHLTPSGLKASNTADVIFEDYGQRFIALV